MTDPETLLFPGRRPILRRCLLGLVLVAVVLFVLFPPRVRAGDTVPSIRDLSVETPALGDLLGNRQFVLLHDSGPVSINEDTRNVRYVTSAVIVDTTPRFVRRAITGFDRYPDLFPAYTSTAIQRSNQGETRVQFDLSLNMAIIEPEVRYTLEFEAGPDGDLTFRRRSGDFLVRRGRWELFEQGENKTLLCLTGLIDYSGLGWSVDVILWAQPELERALPVTRTATLVETLRRAAEGEAADSVDPVPRTEPRIPSVLADTAHHAVLRELTRDGTPMFIHPAQFLRSDGDTIDLIFSSTVDRVDGPVDRARTLLTNFEKVPDFIRQLETVNATRTDTGFVADWQFDLGFGVASIPVQYRVVYEWMTPNRLLYRRIRGDFRHIYGSYEWAPLSEDETLYAFTSASHIGEDAPTMVKLGNLIPNRQIFMGVTLGAIGVENGVKWANEQIHSERPPDTEPSP